MHSNECGDIHWGHMKACARFLVDCKRANDGSRHTFKERKLLEKVWQTKKKKPDSISRQEIPTCASSFLLLWTRSHVSVLRVDSRHVCFFLFLFFGISCVCENRFELVVFSFRPRFKIYRCFT